jgi:Ca2+-binding RTX toxin-like protein
MSKKCSAKTVMTKRLPDLLDWYIQADKEGMTAMAGDEPAFMLGGSDIDHLIGGSRADVLVGNQGRDILFGGDGDDTLWSLGTRAMI